MFPRIILLFGLLRLAASEDPVWFMMVGGLNSLDKVSLYNWQTRQECDLAPAPFYSYGSPAVSFDGVPLVCGAVKFVTDTKDLCFKYDTANKNWNQVANLIVPVDLGASVMIQDKGWYIFGGNQNVRSQKLASINGKWEYGPPLHDGRPVSQHCAVKISDTVTAFIGGDVMPNGIVTFDWSTMTSQRNDLEFKEPRLEAACAVVTTSSGEKVVAVVGGINAKSLEMWNPSKGTIETLTEVIPASIGSVYGLPSPQMFVVNGGKELVAFFGFPDVRIAYGEVWRYQVDTNTWVKDHTLSHGKFRHAAIPVSGLTC